MPTILNEIGFFQFDNLIRNRIPFIILNLGVDIKNFYKLPLYQNHLEGVAVNTTRGEALTELQNRKIPQHEAVLVLCSTGTESAQVVDELEKAGYSNVFFVKNGYDSLKADASH